MPYDQRMGAAKQIVKGSTAVSAVFASADLLDAIIVSSLTCREAAQVHAVKPRCTTVFAQPTSPCVA